MHQNEKQATLIASGKQVIVYKHKERNTWIDSGDLQTEYQPNELKF